MQEILCSHALVFGSCSSQAAVCSEEQRRSPHRAAFHVLLPVCHQRVGKVYIGKTQHLQWLGLGLAKSLSINMVPREAREVLCSKGCYM